MYGMSRPGLASAAAYQVSGTPFITGVVIPAGTQHVKVEFPCVTKSITIIVNDANKNWPTGSASGSTDLNVFFGQDPTGSYPYPQIFQNHYITIPSGSSENQNGFTFDVKCERVFISKFNKDAVGSFQLIAELTSIDRYDLWKDGVGGARLSGSGICE